MNTKFNHIVVLAMTVIIAGAAIWYHCMKANQAELAMADAIIEQGALDCGEPSPL